MWLSKADYERLITDAAQVKPLREAFVAMTERAVSAEDNLVAERNAKDWLITQLTSRFLTKQGSYGLDHEPRPIESPTHPQGFTHDPTEIDLAKLEYYKQCARAAGHDEEDAVARWESEMRGEGLPIETETEN